MTNPRTDESRPAAGRSKPPVTSASKVDRPIDKSAKDVEVATYPPSHDPNVVLAQLVSLTQSISALVGQNAETGDGKSNDSPERRRVVFAYDFLAGVVGRSTPSLFTRVTVERRSDTLTFTNLAGATAARIRTATNIVRDLDNLQEGVAVNINQGDKAINDDQRIDSIVTFTAPGGVPVAIGPCLGPVTSIIIG
jgi:hypothetical protein